MNRTASPTFANRKSSAEIVAKLNLADEAQRRVHDLVRRFHSGRWPLFRCLGMQQADGLLCEAVQWCRMAKPNYSVVEYHRDGYGLSWRSYRTKAEALSALRVLESQPAALTHR